MSFVQYCRQFVEIYKSVCMWKIIGLGQPSRKFQMANAHVVFQTCFRPSFEDSLRLRVEACLLWPAVACRGVDANCRVASMPLDKSALTLKPQ